MIYFCIRTHWRLGLAWTLALTPLVAAPAFAETTKVSFTDFSSVSDATCTAPEREGAGAPPGLRINDEFVVSNLTSVMDTDSKPLTIDYPAGTARKPLQLALPNPQDNAQLLRLSNTRWVYSPGLPAAIDPTAAQSQSNQAPMKLLDICAGGYHSRVQIWNTEYQADLSARYPDPYQSPLPHKYDTPIYFMQIDPQSAASQRLSTHFTVEQFLPFKSVSRANEQWPKPLLIRLPLLEKLEAVLQVLAENDKPAATLTILSGYRTPRYNRRVGGAPYSRHIYGDAVDFIVDTNQDGKMDDLNGDGKVSRADLGWLLERLANKSVPITAGGVGAYESHGQAEAFLHIDARGRAAYWQ